MWTRKVVQAQWREEGSDGAFQDLGSAIEESELRRRPVGTGHRYEGYIVWKGGTSWSELEELRTADKERRVELRLQLAGEDEWMRFSHHATVRKRDEPDRFQLEIGTVLYHPFES